MDNVQLTESSSAIQVLKNESLLAQTVHIQLHEDPSSKQIQESNQQFWTLMLEYYHVTVKEKIEI